MFGVDKERHLKRQNGVIEAFSMIGQFGINMIVPIFLCSFAGHFLDKKLGTGFIVIIGFFIGAVTGGYNVYRMAKRIFSQQSTDTSAFEGSGSRAEREDDGED